jgi:hypothetical protein
VADAMCNNIGDTCMGAMAGEVFWNCSAKPGNLAGCTQVDLATFNFAYCCPP